MYSTTGKSGEINLETINWGNYDLIVVDESHNFRNSSTAKEGYTRYSRLMDDIIRSGVKTKVLTLSATPVNNRMNALKNQVAFITEGQDTAFEAQGISSIEITLKKAQTQFNPMAKAGRRAAQHPIPAGGDEFRLFQAAGPAHHRPLPQAY